MLLQLLHLPLLAQVLPGRVCKICEEVGIPCGPPASLTLEDMSSLLKHVAGEVGVAL